MDDLEIQAQKELDAMVGINTDSEEVETDVDTEVETEEDTDVQTDSEDEIEEDSQEDSEDDSEEDKPKSKKEKTEERFKKILSKKNDLATRVSELENMLADKDFYWDRPQAVKFKDEINSIMESNPNLSRDDAFNMIAGRENLSTRPKGLIGKPKSPEGVKDIKDMTTKELEAQFEKLWGINSLLK